MNLIESKITAILNEELTKSEVQSLISSKINSSYNSPQFKKEVKELASKVVEELFKTLWQKRSFWENDIKR